MASVFDILNRKSSTSVEVTENVQMSRISSRTSSSSDSLQVQGVNNDASAFENKDGAKASGNYAYGVESRHETQETSSPFTIPKLKRSKQELFMDVPVESREWQQEILPTLTKYFRFPSSSARFEFLRVLMIQNAERTQKYLEKRKEMRQNGYSERDITDSFAFLYVDDDKQIDRICREGLRIGNLTSSTIGHPGMGAQLCRYMDTIRPVSFSHGSTGKLIVFKVMKGKVKAVTENRSGPSLEPTPNFECHMAKSSLDVTPASQQQLYELYQVYLYEYGEDLSVEPYPRHVLPYAVITFRYKEAPPSPRLLESPPMFSPRLASPTVPKFTVSAPKEADDPEYVIWCGHLRVKDILDCQVKMVSTASQYKPAHLGTVLNVRDTCEMKVAGERYFKELSCLRKSGEVYWKGWYINVAELRPRPDSKMQFQRLMNHLSRTDSVAVLKPENDVILLLAPNGVLMHNLGLTKPHHYPLMFHCIFVSKQSSKFKSPGYIQKGLHQMSGSSTPNWFDSGQISPISINIHPSSQPRTAPGSPALLSPSLGLTIHSGTDRSPGYGPSPRDELAVWTDALSVGRLAGSSSSSSVCQSAGEEKDDVPTRAHDLLRLHRSLSTDLATQDSPDKTIPLGFDEGFLSAMPPSARINPQRLKNAFAIQHQIQEGMALSPAEPLLRELPSGGAAVMMSPSSFTKGQRDDVEQDDTITSSTSLDHTSQPISRLRSASTDATFSPVPSPENTSEPDETGVDLSVQSESSLLTVPKETHHRTKSLYIPPPNIPEYRPTPLHEPQAKRYKVDESGSRHSSSTSSVERGSSSSSSSRSCLSAGLSYRTSTINVPTVGLTHVRSPRDLPLPISPADSSTDKLKSPSPVSSNITTANDMKNFLNASLERKPSSRPPLSMSRSQSAFPAIPISSGAHQTFLSTHCALNLQTRSDLAQATRRNEDHLGTTTANPAGVGGTSLVPSIIISIPFSRLHRLPVARRRRKQPSHTVKGLEKAQKYTLQIADISEESEVAQNDPSSLSRKPSISPWCSSVTVKRNEQNVNSHVQRYVTQTTYGDQVDGDFKNNTGLCEGVVEVKHQQLSSSFLQPVSKSRLLCCDDNGVIDRGHHRFILGLPEDFSKARHCDQPSYLGQTSQPLQQNKQMSALLQHNKQVSGPVKQSYVDNSISHRKQGNQPLCEGRQRTEPYSQLCTTGHDDSQWNSEASVPLDVLDLINRLKAVARERMIEETVAKLMNLHTSYEKSPLLAAPAVNSAADRNTKGEKVEDRLCLLDKNEYGCNSIEKESGTFLFIPHSDVSSQNLHANSMASENVIDIKSCGTDCESFMKPSNECCELPCVSHTAVDLFQLETDIDEESDEKGAVCVENISKQQYAERQPAQNDTFPAVDDGCKHVPPLILRRQAGSLKDKFKIVNVHPVSNCDEDTVHCDVSSEEETSDICGWKLKKKDGATKADKKFRSKSSKKKSAALEPSDTDSVSCTNITKLFSETCQSHTSVQESMELKDGSEINKEPAGNSFADNLDGDNDISVSISAVIGLEMPDIDAEVVDSDKIVEPIKRVLSENNSPVYDASFCSDQMETPDKENEHVSPSCAHITGCGTVENAVQIDKDSNSIRASQGGCVLSVSKRSSEDSTVNKGKKERGQKYRSLKKKGAVRVVSSKTCKEGDRKKMNRCTQSLTSGSEISHDWNSHCSPQMKPCSVVITDLNSSGLQMNIQDRYLVTSGQIYPLSKNSKSSHISQHQKANENHSDCLDSLQTSCTRKTSVGDNDVPVGHASNSLVALEDNDVAVCIRLEGSQPLSCSENSSFFAYGKPEFEDRENISTENGNVFACSKPDLEVRENPNGGNAIPFVNGQPESEDIGKNKSQGNGALFASSRPELEPRKGSISPYALQTKGTDSTEYLKKTERVEKCKAVSSFKRELQPTCARKVSGVPTTAQAGKAILKSPKSRAGLDRKQTNVTCKRKSNQALKPSFQSGNRQGCASQNHSWHDVLQEMNKLSAISCANKVPSEPSKSSLPRIPKKKKQQEDPCPVSRARNSPSTQRPGQENVQQTASGKQREKVVESDCRSFKALESSKIKPAEETNTTVQTVQEIHSASKNQVETRNFSYHQTRETPYLGIGAQTNLKYHTSQNKISPVPVVANLTSITTNLLSSCHTNSRTCSFSSASSAGAGYFKQVIPESKRIENSQHFGDIFKSDDLQQRHFPVFQPASSMSSQREPAEKKTAQTVFDNGDGHRQLKPHEVTSTYLKYTTRSMNIPEADCTKLSRDPRKRALMDRGYAGIKPSTPPGVKSLVPPGEKQSAPPYLLDHGGRKSSVCDPLCTTFRVMNFKPSSQPKDCSQEGNLNAVFDLQTEHSSFNSNSQCSTPSCQLTSAEDEKIPFANHGSAYYREQAKTDMKLSDAEGVHFGGSRDVIKTDSSNIKHRMVQRDSFEVMQESVKNTKRFVDIQSNYAGHCIMSTSEQFDHDSAAMEILRNSSPFMNKIAVQSMSAEVRDPSDGTIERVKENFVETNGKDMPENTHPHSAQNKSSAYNLESSEDVNGTVTVNQSTNALSCYHHDVNSEANMEKTAAGDFTKLEAIAFTTATENLDKSLQNTDRDSMDQQATESFAVRDTSGSPSKPWDAEDSEKMHISETSDIVPQKLKKDGISSPLSGFNATGKEVTTSESGLECSEVIQEHTESLFLEGTVEKDFLIKDDGMKIQQLVHESNGSESCVEITASRSRSMSAEKSETLTSGLSSESLFEMETDFSSVANTNSVANMTHVLAITDSHFNKSAASIQPNTSTRLISTPSSTSIDLSVAETASSEIIRESPHNWQEKTPCSGNTSQAKRRSNLETDEEVLLPEEFTVVDECGDTSASICEVVYNHFSSEGDLKSDQTPEKRKSKEVLKKNDKWSENAAHSLTADPRRPRLAPGVLLKFANTVMKNYSDNKKLDLKQKRSTCLSRHQSQSPSASLTKQTSAPGTSKKSASCSQKKRLASQPSDEQLQLGSSKKRKPQLPAADEEVEKQSTHEQQRARSPSSRRRARSRSPSGSGAGSPSRRKGNPREQRQPGPTRHRDKEQIVEDRHHRQYHPYSSRGRDNCRRGYWTREEDKPIADFNLAYGELCELLADKTSQTFQKRLIEKSMSCTALFNDKCYEGQRFSDYRFRRSKVPSYSEFKTLASIEESEQAGKQAASIECKTEVERLDEEERAQMAETLDEILGEIELPCKGDGTELKIHKKHEPSATVSSASVVSEKLQGSPGGKNADDRSFTGQGPQCTLASSSRVGTVDQSFQGQASSRLSPLIKTDGDGQPLPERVFHSAVASFLPVKNKDDGNQSVQEQVLHGSVSVSDRERCLESNSKGTSEESDLKPVMALEEQEVDSKQKSISSYPVNVPNSLPAFESTICSSDLHRKLDIHETFINVKFGNTHSQNSKVTYHQQSRDDHLDGVFRQGITRCHFGEQKHFQEAAITDHTQMKQNSRGKQWKELRDASLHSFSHVTQEKEKMCSNTQNGGQDSKPVHKGPHTPPGPCPADSPGQLSPGLFTYAQDTSASVNNVSLDGREPLAATVSMSSADSCSGLPEIPDLPARVLISHGIDKTRQVHDPRMTSDQSALYPNNLFCENRLLNQSQRRKTEHQSPSEPRAGEKSAPAFPFMSANQILNSCAASVVGADLKRDGNDMTHSLVCEEPDSATVLKIINTARLNAAASQVPNSQSMSCLLPSCSSASCRPLHSVPGADLSRSYLWPKMPDSSMSGVQRLVQADELPVTTCGPAQHLQVSLASSQPAAQGEVPFSGEYAVSEARQNMDKLVQQLRSYLASMEQAGNAVEENSVVPAQGTPPSCHRPVRRRHRKHAVRVPWKLRLWPGVPPLITFVKRHPDYQQHPSLAEQGVMVEVTMRGSDPRLDPNRPVLVRGAKSRQARRRDRKRRILISIKVVKAIPLEPVLLPGRSLPRDPRHSFRSCVDESELPEREQNEDENSTADSDDKEEEEDARSASSENGRALSKEEDDPQPQFEVITDQSEYCLSVEISHSCQEETCEGQRKDTCEKGASASKPEHQQSMSEQTEGTSEQQESTLEQQENTSEEQEDTSEEQENTSEQQENIPDQRGRTLKEVKNFDEQDKNGLEPHSSKLNLQEHIPQEQENRPWHNAECWESDPVHLGRYTELPESQSDQQKDLEEQESRAEAEPLKSSLEDLVCKMEWSEISVTEESLARQQENNPVQPEENITEQRGNDPEQEENKPGQEENCFGVEEDSEQQETCSGQQEKNSERLENSLQKDKHNSEEQENLTWQQDDDSQQEKTYMEQEDSEQKENNLEQQACGCELQDLTTNVFTEKSDATLLTDMNHHTDIVSKHQTTEPGEHDTHVTEGSSTSRLETNSHSENELESIKSESLEQTNQNTTLLSPSLTMSEFSDSKFDFDGGTGESYSVPLPRIVEELEGLRKRKHSASSSGALPEKKARVSIHSEPCPSESSSMSTVGRQNQFLDAQSEQVSDAFLKHREALDQELMDDIMHLDRCQITCHPETEFVAPELSVGDRTILSSISSSLVTTTVTLTTSDKILSTEACAPKMENNASQAYPGSAYEYIEILSSSNYSEDLEDHSDLEEGEIRDSPVKPLYRICRDGKPPSQSLAKKECNSRDHACEEKDCEMEEPNSDVMFIKEEFTQTSPVFRPLSLDESTHLELSSSHKQFKTCDITLTNSNNSQPVNENDAMNKLQIDAIACAQITEDDNIYNKSLLEDMSDSSQHSVTSVSASCLLSKLVNSLPSAQNSSSSELVTVADSEQSCCSEHMSVDPFQPSKMCNGKSELTYCLAKESQQIPHSSVPPAVKVTDCEISDFLVKSFNDSSVSCSTGTNVSTSDVDHIFQHNPWPSQCTEVIVTPSCGSQENSVKSYSQENSVKSSLLPREIAQVAISANLDSPHSHLIERNLGHCQALCVDSLRQSVSFEMPCIVSVKDSVVSTPANSRVTYSKPVHSVGLENNIPCTLSCRPRPPQNDSEIQLAGGMAGPADPQFQISCPLNCVEAAARTGQLTASPNTNYSAGASNSVMDMNNRQHSFSHNRYCEPEESRHPGRNSFGHGSNQQQIIANHQSFGLHNTVPSQCFSWRTPAVARGVTSPIHHMQAYQNPAMMLPFNCIHPYKSLSRMSATNELHAHQNPSSISPSDMLQSSQSGNDVANQSLAYASKSRNDVPSQSHTCSSKSRSVSSRSQACSSEFCKCKDACSWESS